MQLARPTSLARTPQVDVHYHYECAQAYALYPMVALQRASYSDTEALERPDDWNQDKLAREKRRARRGPRAGRRRAAAGGLGRAGRGRAQ